MSTIQEQTPPAICAAPVSIRDSAAFESHLSELETLLQRGIELVRAEKYDEFADIGAGMGDMLHAVTHTDAHITHIAFETIGRIKKLHYELGLILASRHDETAKKLAQIKTGKSVHKAYKNALG